MTLRSMLPNMSEDVERLNPQLTAPDKTKHVKFLSRKEEYKGRIYDSEWECQHAQELDLLLKAGEIAGWTPQFCIMLRDGIMMFVDFLVLNTDGTCELHECKSQPTKTRVYRNNVKMLKGKYPAIKFLELVKPDWREK